MDGQPIGLLGIVEQPIYMVGIAMTQHRQIDLAGAYPTQRFPDPLPASLRPTVHKDGRSGSLLRVPMQ